MTSHLHTGDCSSRLQDSELAALRVRVGVLEGALREAFGFVDLDEPDIREWLAKARAVLAGGEAGKEKP